MDRSTRQALLAEVWNAEGIEALLSLMARSSVARDHALIGELHEQSVECQKTAPEVAAALHRVAGQLTELHAGLRSAEGVDEVAGLLAWQTEVAWRSSDAMQALLRAVAADDGSERWPWRLERLPGLWAELDQLLAMARELTGVSPAERRRRIEAEPRLRSPALLAWLTAQAPAPGDGASALGQLREHVLAWQRLRSPDSDPSGPIDLRTEPAVLAELMELWHRLDPERDRIYAALRAEIVAGDRSLDDAMRAVVEPEHSPEQATGCQAALLQHLLDQRAASVRRDALVAWSRLVTSLDVQAFDPVTRGTLVRRWAAALVLHWRVLLDPSSAIDAALRWVDQTLPPVLGADASRLAGELMITRARLLARLARWHEGKREEAIRAYHMVLDVPGDGLSDVELGRLCGELAGLRRGRRELREQAQDREIRALYDRALERLEGSVAVRARVLSDYAVYLARPLRPGVEDAEHSLELARGAVELLERLADGVRAHPILRGDEAEHCITRGNLRIEVGGGEPSSRREAAVVDYEQALDRIGDDDVILAGLVHLNLACVALASAAAERDEHFRVRARVELDWAVAMLSALPVAHARAVTERAMLAVEAAPDDAGLRDRSIHEVEAALHRLPVGADRVVRGRVERQLGELYLARGGPDDVTRAAEHFATARRAFVEGSAARLAVEAARDYAATQRRLHDVDDGAGSLIRGAVVLEQAALLAERRWALRRAGEPTRELVAMLDGVYRDLAWFQATLGRPAEEVLRTATRAKHYRATPSLRVLRGRAERSSMLSPAHVDPLARRHPPSPAARPHRRGLSAAELRGRVDAFTAANPEVVAMDLTLTQWGTVVVVAGAEGLACGTIALTRAQVRRWVWGDGADEGWWGDYAAHCEARSAGSAGSSAESSTGASSDAERRWRAAGERMSRALGEQLFGAATAALACSLAGRIVVVAAGHLSGLPLGAARMGAALLVGHAKGLAQCASLAGLAGERLPRGRPGPSLCVLAEPGAVPEGSGAVDEARDVVRLLASARSSVEVLARMGGAGADGSIRPTQAKTRERTVMSEQWPTVDAVLERVRRAEHLFYGGHGRALGLVLLDGAGRSAQLDAAALRRGPRWAPGSSVFVSATAHHPPPRDDAALWSLLHGFADAGVGCVVVAGRVVSAELAREFSRGFYLYWALGRGILEASGAALASVAGNDPCGMGAFVVWLGPSRSDESPG